MSEIAPVEQQSPDPTAPGSPSKRKRGAESASPDARRSKRGAAAPTVPTAFMEATAQDQAVAAEGTTDFGAVPAAGQAAVAAEGADQTAAAAAAADAASQQQRTNAANAATAAAVLDSMFPQLTVPVPTEETFANQHVDGEQHHADASAYSAGDVTQGDLSLDVGSNGVAKRPMAGIQSKPAVGSEEWHKMRKDNHKEGAYTPF